jgi:glycosyltransferase involved in cell wall biosynthesis
MNPYISVIMLAYKNEKTLAQAAFSVLQNEDVELVLVDPKKAKTTQDVAKALKALFPRNNIVAVYDKDNSPGEGLNNGLKVCSGNIIGFINGDDMMMPGSIKYVHDFFERHTDTQVLLGSGLVWYETDMMLKIVLSTKLTPYMLSISHLGGSTLFQQGIFWRRELTDLIKFNASNRFSWDAEFIRDLVMSGVKLKEDKAILGLFRIHEHSITGSGMYKSEYEIWSQNNSKSLAKPRTLPFNFILANFFRLKRQITILFLLVRQTIKS